MLSKTQSLNIVENIARMLGRRGLHPVEKALEGLRKGYDSSQDTAVWENIRIKIIQETVKNVNKTAGLLPFINQSQDNHCFIVVNNIFCQPFKLLMSMPNVEVFWSFEFVKDLYTNVLIPNHRLLTDNEKEQIQQEYQVRTKNMPRLDKTDFIARYLGLKVGDWVEIERPSVSSGISVAYRVVTNCSWESMFR